MQDKNYLTTGEFAKLCNTTKNTLFHYYDIGLFLPQFIDKNGYRYYHVLQYDNFITIKQLRELGMKLSEIKNYFLNRSPQNMAKLYQHQEQLLNKKIKNLELLKSNIYEQRRNIENSFLYPQKYFIEVLDEQYLIYSNKLTVIDDKIMTYEFGNLLKKSENILTPCTFGMVHNLCDIKKNCFNFRFYTRISKKEKMIKPAGKYLCTYYVGKYENLFSEYNKFLIYAQNNRFDLCEKLFVETVAGEWAANHTDDYIIKIYSKINY